jgi:hypothetical protein
VGDEFVLLRHGRVAGTWEKDAITLERLAAEMAGDANAP